MFIQPTNSSPAPLLAFGLGVAWLGILTMAARRSGMWWHVRWWLRWNLINGRDRIWHRCHRRILHDKSVRYLPADGVRFKLRGYRRLGPKLVLVVTTPLRHFHSNQFDFGGYHDGWHTQLSFRIIISAHNRSEEVHVHHIVHDDGPLILIMEPRLTGPIDSLRIIPDLGIRDEPYTPFMPTRKPLPVIRVVLADVTPRSCHRTVIS